MKNCRCLRIWFVQLSFSIRHSPHSWQSRFIYAANSFIIFVFCIILPTLPVFPKAGSMNVISDPLSNQNIFAITGNSVYIRNILRLTFRLLTIASTPRHWSGAMSSLFPSFIKVFCVCSWTRAHKIHPIEGTKSRKDSFAQWRKFFQFIQCRMKKMPYFTETIRKTPRELRRMSAIFH